MIKLTKWIQAFGDTDMRLMPKVQPHRRNAGKGAFEHRPRLVSPQLSRRSPGRLFDPQGVRSPGVGWPLPRRKLTFQEGRFGTALVTFQIVCANIAAESDECHAPTKRSPMTCRAAGETA
jgi:hypothetical protein